MDLNLNGKTAVVCGSTQGIGKAVATELAQLGARIILLARNKQKLDDVINTLPAANNQKHGYMVADFMEPKTVADAAQSILTQFGDINILVNNTGGPPAGKAIEADIEAYRIAFNQHLINNQILAQTFVEGMKSSGYGRIINIISTSVKIPLDNLGVSNTVRGAVANWSKTLANELGTFGITVNNVLPGATNTERLSQIVNNHALKDNKPTNEVLNEMIKIVPLKRVGKPEEVANAVAFLASPAAAYISGINLPVDGGRTKAL